MKSSLLVNKRKRQFHEDEEHKVTFSPRLLDLVSLLENDKSFLYKYENNLLNLSKVPKEERKHVKTKKQFQSLMDNVIDNQESEHEQSSCLNYHESKNLRDIESSFSRKVKERMLMSSSMADSVDCYIEAEKNSCKSESNSESEIRLDNRSTSKKITRINKSFKCGENRKNKTSENLDIDHFSEQIYSDDDKNPIQNYITLSPHNIESEIKNIEDIITRTIFFKKRKNLKISKKSVKIKKIKKIKSPDRKSVV